MTHPVVALVAAAAVGAPHVAFVIGDSRITESSGLVASPTHAGVYWTHNDSGDSSRTFALDSRGRTLGVWRWQVAKARDWEAVTASTDPAGRGLLWAGDIGDNSGSRTNGILVHRAVEPAEVAGGGTLRATSYRLRYPDEPHDAEAMFVGRDGRLRVVTKGLLGGRVFVVPKSLSSAHPNVLEPEADAPFLVTDAAEMPNGDYVLRNYTTAYLYEADGALIQSFDLPEQPQGESMTVVDGGKALLVGSEGRRSTVLRVPVPTVPAPEPMPSGTAPVEPGASAAADDDETLRRVVRGLTVVTTTAAGLLVLVLVGAGAAWLRGRRR
ncbi:hypothetical protein CLV35_3670 [Motilibacter peucedani]|uniref:Uncharacterized protein n=1 Tax=Motilibacter peucedani TaxID=598650 RepID=A0A420XK91_9ACTN|nr:hypothetical protein [Motilibacter peucedani]RKS68542.1 hypothetical protein CLV35_3670 [Motilibacter peucedani]